SARAHVTPGKTGPHPRGGGSRRGRGGGPPGPPPPPRSRRSSRPGSTRSRCPDGPSAPRSPADHTTRPAASPVPAPHTTPDSDHRMTHVPPGCLAVISSHRCPLELERGSFNNSHSPSSEGIPMPQVRASTKVSRWIEAQNREQVWRGVCSGHRGRFARGGNHRRTLGHTRTAIPRGHRAARQVDRDCGPAAIWLYRTAVLPVIASLRREPHS